MDTAGTGAQAVMRMMTASPGHYDYVLMDLMMPEMDGFEAARLIRALPDNGRSRVPIIAMTAGGSPEDRLKAEASGMNGFVEKPLHPEQLFRLMQGMR